MRPCWPVVLVLACALTACQRPPAIQLSKFSHGTPFPNLMGPSGDLSAPPSSLYLKNWQQSPGELPIPPRKARVRFVCARPQASEVELVGCSEEAEVVGVYVGDHLLGRLKLAEDWRRFRYQIPAEALQVGENWLLLEGGGDTATWSSLVVRPAEQPRTHAGKAPWAGFKDGDLLLPYGSTLEFPLEVIQDPELILDGLELWNEAGAPRPALSALELTAESGSPLWCQRLEIAPGGPSRYKLKPPSDTTRISLTLQARGGQGLKPGQLGLRLRKPRVQGIQGPPPSPSSKKVPAAPRDRPPNVILYVVDTLRGDHLRPKLMPELAKLARDGYRFEKVQAQSCWTKPSVASILTSKPPEEHGCLDFGDRLSDRLETLAECFARAGYQVQGVVTNVYVSEAFGYGQGFAGFQYLSLAPSAQVQQFLEGWLARRDPSRPFFLYVHSFDPHSPYEPPKAFLSDRAGPRCFSDEHLRQLGSSAWLGREGEQKQQLAVARRLYADEVRANDHSIGALMDTLKKRKLYDSTLVAVTSDHGEEFLEHGLTGHNTSLYQELLEVPWVLKLPGGEAVGKSVGGLWQHLDIAPTLLHHAGLPVPAGMRGRVFVPSGQPPDEPVLFSVHSGADLKSYQPSLTPYELQARGIRWGPWVLIQARSSSPMRLYPLELHNLEEDPLQQNNLAYQRPEIRALLGYLLRQRAGTSAQPEKLPQEEIHRKVRELPYLR